ncbi:MAG: hypothetical protein D6762_00520 [Candidatus Neomarinimicrobiota bacterium]|nr:MAG: hypothetical protein D6762_00520 [Candidatus Neomarinimicrobiota bacterium]
MRAVLLFLLGAFLGAQSHPGVVMTIYKDGYALVKSDVKWAFPTPGNTVRLGNLPSGILDTSPFLQLTNGRVLDQTLKRDRSQGWTRLEHLIGQEVEVRITNEKSHTGRLVEVGAASITLQEKEEIRVITRDKIDYILTDGTVTAHPTSPELIWHLQSAAEDTVRGTLLYFSSGFEWKANYRLLMESSGTAARLEVDAQVANHSQATYPGTHLQLVEGKLQRPTSPPVQPQPMGMRAKALDVESAGYPAEKSLGDFHIYRLDRTYDLTPGDLVSVPLYAPRDVTYRKTYVFASSERSSKEEPLKLELELDNSAENHLNLPLPAGVIQLFLETETGLEFLGEDQFRPVPKGETVKLEGGRAFDVIGKRRILNYSQQRKSAEASIEITITNHREESIQVKVVETITGNWVIRDESAMYIKQDANTIYFPSTLEPNTSQVITYTYRKSWN